MPKGKDPTLASRDRQMISDYLSGQVSVAELAEREGITPQRVYQVLAKIARSDVPEDASVDEHTIMLQDVRGILYRETMKGPQPMANVKGELIDAPDGGYLVDQQAWTTVARTFIIADESIRKLKARDLPRRKQMSIDEATKEMLADIAARQAVLNSTVIHAEILPAEDRPEPPVNPVGVDGGGEMVEDHSSNDFASQSATIDQSTRGRGATEMRKTGSGKAEGP